MKKGEIKEVLRELNNATGFRISLHDAEAEEIYAAPPQVRGLCAAIQADPSERMMCRRCDSVACKKALESESTYSYKCRYGLTEIVSPIYNFDRHVGYIMMGQTFETDEDRKRAAELLEKRIPDQEERARLIREVPTVPTKLASSFAKILTISAKYLTLSGAVYGNIETTAESAMRYIKENYAGKIYIKDICQKLGCSKSTLLAAFKDEYGITVGAALASVRLEAARQKLALSSYESINDIALSSGFSDQSYFCKVFSSEYGESPSEYRKRIASKEAGDLFTLPEVCTAHTR